MNKFSPVEAACLYVVATPIGNLADISQRALDVLAHVDRIAAEDTRHSGKLLAHYQLEGQLISVHEHNERQRCDLIVSWLAKGLSVALISDAGTPLISDPGYPLVNAVLTAGYHVVPIPGANAMLAALSVSGLATDRFAFEGFLPAKRKARLDSLAALVSDTRSLAFYVSRHQLRDSVTDMLDCFGAERAVVLAREVTKLHEQFYRGRLGDLPTWLEADPNRQRGEFVVLLEGCRTKDDSEIISLSVDQMLIKLAEELPVKQAAAIGAKLSGLAKNQLYKRLLAMR